MTRVSFRGTRCGGTGIGVRGGRARRERRVWRHEAVRERGGAVSALRRAGVWLGLVEEEDERPDVAYDDEFDDTDDEDFAPPPRPRSLARPAQRTADREPR